MPVLFSGAVLTLSMSLWVYVYLDLAQSAFLRHRGGGKSWRATGLLSPLLGEVWCSRWGFFFLDSGDPSVILLCSLFINSQLKFESCTIASHSLTLFHYARQRGFVMPLTYAVCTERS